VLPTINPEWHLPASGGDTLRNAQLHLPHFTDRGFWGKATVFDNLIFDLLGMALAVLCLAGLLAPSRRPSRRAISDI
jgi:hypothetical protein